VDVSGITELKAELAAVGHGEDVIRWVTERTRGLIGAQRASTYGLSPTVDGLRIDFGHWAGFALGSARCNALIDAALGQKGAFGAYDPLHPEVGQRNRVVAFAPLREMIERPGAGMARTFRRAAEREAISARFRAHAGLFGAIDALDLAQCRVLICDGPRLLGWFGIYDDRPFTPRRRATLRAIAALFRDRLRLDHELRTGALPAAAFDVALDAIARPAFVLARNGHVLHANRAGRELLQTEPDTARQLLRRAHASVPVHGLDVFRIAARGQPAMSLVVVRSDPASDARRHRAVVRAWALTPREGQVLEIVVHGRSNREIAMSLSIAEATVEIHVSRLLAKARVPGRAALVTAYWTVLR